MVNCFFEVLGPGPAPAETRPRQQRLLSFLLLLCLGGALYKNIMTSIPEVYHRFINQTPFILNFKSTRLNY